MKKLPITCLLVGFFASCWVRAGALAISVPAFGPSDTLPLQIFCPADIVVDLQPTACDTVLNYSIGAEGGRGFQLNPVCCFMPNGKWFAKKSEDKSMIINMIYPENLANH